jgi:RNA polymerase sigma factor (sigma-70 family)
MQPEGFRELVRLAQEGDPEAIARLFGAVLPFVEGLVRARGVRAGDSARDHAQDTCLRILTRLHQFRGALVAEDDAEVLALFRKWVRLIARTGIINRTRKARAQATVSLQSTEGGESTDGGGIDPPGRELSGSAKVRADERARLIQEAIDALADPTEREILQRRFFEEQKLKVIAAELGLSYDQVRERWRQSGKRLQRRLEGLL